MNKINFFQIKGSDFNVRLGVRFAKIYLLKVNIEIFHFLGIYNLFLQVMRRISLVGILVDFVKKNEKSKKTEKTIVFLAKTI